MSHAGWSESPTSLVEAFDALLLDLDGVVYTGPDAVPGARDALTAAREHGVSRMFVLRGRVSRICGEAQNLSASKRRW